VETIKQTTWAACGYLAARRKSHVLGHSLRPVGSTRAVTQAPLQL